MHRFPLLLPVLLACAGHAAASDGTATLTSADGGRYAVRHNAHGAVLRGGGGVIYLGRDCDAWSRDGGRGRWQWANGGVVVELQHRRVAFPRQEVAVAGAEGCRG